MFEVALENGNGWRRLAVIATAIAALLASLAAFGFTPGDVSAMANAEEAHEAIDRNERVLRCLLRADPRKGPAIEQCEGDPLDNY